MLPDGDKQCRCCSQDAEGRKEWQSSLISCSFVCIMVVTMIWTTRMKGATKPFLRPCRHISKLYVRSSFECPQKTIFNFCTQKCALRVDAKGRCARYIANTLTLRWQTHSIQNKFRHTCSTFDFFSFGTMCRICVHAKRISLTCCLVIVVELRKKEMF